MIPGVAEGELIARARAAQPVPIGRLTGDGAVLVLAPHADDETLGCGAAIAAAVAAGRRVVVALLTDGGASHPNSPSYPRPVLVAARAAEFTAAVHSLGDGAIETVMLGLGDSAMPVDDRDAGPVIGRLAALARRIGATAIWSSWGGDPHCDHEVAALYARKLAARLAAGGSAVRLWSYAVWGRFGDHGAAAEPGSIRLFEDPALAGRKRAAMDAYRTQLTPLIDDDPDGFVMPAALVDHFARHPEIFIREDPADV